MHGKLGGKSKRLSIIIGHRCLFNITASEASKLGLLSTQPELVWVILSYDVYTLGLKIRLFD